MLARRYILRFPRRIHAIQAHKGAATISTRSSVRCLSVASESPPRTNERPVTVEERRQWEAKKRTWRIEAVKDALVALRGGQVTRPISRPRMAYMLAPYSKHLGAKDLLLLTCQALEEKVTGPAFTALTQLRERHLETVLENADKLVLLACRATSVRMVMMIMTDVDSDAGRQHVPTRDTHLAALSLLADRAERLNADTCKFVTDLVLREAWIKDVEVVASALVVLWRAGMYYDVNSVALVAGRAGTVDVHLQGPRPQQTAAVMLAMIKDLARMSSECLKPEHCTMALKSLVEADDVAGALQLLDDCSKAGSVLPQPDARTYSIMIKALGLKGRWEECLHVMKRVKERGGIDHEDRVYKTAIAAIGRVGMWEGVLSLFYEMHERGLKLDAQTYNTLLKALKTAGRLDTALQMIDIMRKHDVTPKRKAYNVIVSALGFAGEVDKALRLFREMQESGLPPHSYDYSTLIAACGRVRPPRVEDAMALLHEAVTVLPPISTDTNINTNGDGTTGQATPTINTTSTTTLRNHKTTNTLLPHSIKTATVKRTTAFASRPGQGDASATDAASMTTEKVASTSNNHHTPTSTTEAVSTHTATLSTTTTTTGCGVEDALEADDEEEEPLLQVDEDAVEHHNGAEGEPKEEDASAESGHALGLLSVYTQALKVLGKAGKWEKACSLLEDMQRRGMDPSFTHCYEAIRSCAKAGQVEAAMRLLEQHKKDHGRAHILCYTAAMDACRVSGSYEAALSLLDTMKHAYIKPGYSNYARAIEACGNGGHVDKALKLLNDLQHTRNIKLDRAVYGAAILTCGRAGRWEDATRVFRDMHARGGLKPDRLSYVNLVHVLGGCGRMAEMVRALEDAVDVGCGSLLGFNRALVAVCENAAAGGRGEGQGERNSSGGSSGAGGFTGVDTDGVALTHAPGHSSTDDLQLRHAGAVGRGVGRSGASNAPGGGMAIGSGGHYVGHRGHVGSETDSDSHLAVQTVSSSAAEQCERMVEWMLDAGIWPNRDTLAIVQAIPGAQATAVKIRDMIDVAVPNNREAEEAADGRNGGSEGSGSGRTTVFIETKQRILMAAELNPHSELRRARIDMWGHSEVR